MSEHTTTMPIGASITYAAFFAILDLWVDSLKMRRAAVEKTVRVSQYIRDATNYSATPTRAHEPSDLDFDEEAEQWVETWTASLFEVHDDARQEQHRLMLALRLLRATSEAMEAQRAYWNAQKNTDGSPLYSLVVIATSVRDLRETLGAVGIDPTLVVFPKWPDRVWL